jgi:hypothetical protein
MQYLQVKYSVVLAAVKMSMLVFWAVTPWDLRADATFQRTILSQSSELKTEAVLKVEAVYPSEKPTWHYNIEYKHR